MTDEEYLALCDQYARRSPDPSRKTGALIVNSGGIVVAKGRNHFPWGIAPTAPRLERPAKYKWIEHAERDAIFSAARQGVKTAHCDMYLNWYPCTDCARAMILAGISRVVCREPDWLDPRWGDDFAIVQEMLSEAEVAVRFIGKFEARAA